MFKRVLIPWLRGTRFCFQCLLTLACWTLWLALAVILGFQLHIVSSKELSLPGPVRRAIEERLAATGLQAEFGHTTFSPSGHILVENVVISARTVREPLATIRALEIHADPWALLVGRYEPKDVHVAGANLYVPAMLSPSGRPEPVISNLEIRFTVTGHTLHIAQASARLGPLAVNGRGALDLPTSRRVDSPELPVMERMVRAYLDYSHRLIGLETRLGGLVAPSLELVLTPSPARMAVVQATLRADGARLASPEVPLPAAVPRVDLGAFEINTTVPLLGQASYALQLHAALARVDLPGRFAATGVRVLTTGDYVPATRALTPHAVELALGRAEARGVIAEGLALTLKPGPRPALDVDLAAVVGDTPWRLRGVGDIRAGRAELAAQGVITPALLDLASGFLGRDLGALLQFKDGPRVNLQARLDHGWKVQSAEGAARIGPVVARRVALDGASANFAFAGRHLEATDIVLNQGESLARGSYTMDTATRDFRFLLAGRLRPAGIDGWLGPWWPRFWSNFDFPGAPPVAEVDVGGRWGVASATTVFVGAEASRAVLRSVPFDRVRTRVFVRPNWYDVLEFNVAQGERTARGWFSREVDLEQNAWRTMTFAATSDLELHGAGRIFGAAGAEILAPYRFTTPPVLQVTGQLDGPASARGSRQALQIDVRSTGPFAFYDFPLGDLQVEARLQDTVLTLNNLRVSFAGGTAEGRAQVSGKTPDRRLAFDAVIKQAVLGDTINILEAYGANRKKVAPSQTKFQQRIAPGRLDVAASAEGRLTDPYSFQGTGNATLAGAELAQINLLGLLSQVLRGAGLGFSTLRLDAARANFAIEQSKLAFSELSITGPTAAIESHGEYHLPTKSMDFTAKVLPFEESQSFLSSAVGAVLSPLSKALELRLTGNLEKPSWVFAYGPTSLLRALTGSQPRLPDDATAPAPPPPQPPAGPPPMLRRKTP